MGYVLLDGLIPLCNDMRNESETRRRFCIEYNGVRADTFFSIEESPFVLAFGIIGRNIYFEMLVNSDFNIKDNVDNETYKAIIDGFNIHSSGGNPFRPRFFIDHIKGQIPHSIGSTQQTTPASLRPYSSNIEESDKIYFIGFRDNHVRKEKVSMANLDKTRRLLGHMAYERCKKENLSSCWTDEAHRDKFDYWKTLWP